MIGRRAVAFGLGSLLASPALAQVRVNDQTMPEPEAPKKKRRDIPFTPLEQIPNHRQLMRDIVVTLSAYAKSRNPKFTVLVRNGPELLVKETREWKWATLRDPDGADKYAKPGFIFRPYLKAIDGMLIDGLSYGAGEYGKPAKEADAKFRLSAIAALKREGRRVLAIDYCNDKVAVKDADERAAKLGVLSYIDRDGEKLLDKIPAARPARENPQAIHSLSDAKNYLPMLRSEQYGTRADWIEALAGTNYDLVILDTFWRETESATFADIAKLKYKRLGSGRMIVGVLPLAFARDTRFYWKPDWKIGNPPFLIDTDPNDPAQMVTNFWDEKWKEIVGKYMQGIVDLGIDGVVFDQVEAYRY